VVKKPTVNFDVKNNIFGDCIPKEPKSGMIRLKTLETTNDR